LSQHVHSMWMDRRTDRGKTIYLTPDFSLWEHKKGALWSQAASFYVHIKILPQYKDQNQLRNCRAKANLMYFVLTRHSAGRHSIPSNWWRLQASILTFVQLSGTSENWRRISRSCITVVRPQGLVTIHVNVCVYVLIVYLRG